MTRSPRLLLAFLLLTLTARTAAAQSCDTVPLRLSGLHTTEIQLARAEQTLGLVAMQSDIIRRAAGHPHSACAQSLTAKASSDVSGGMLVATPARVHIAYRSAYPGGEHDGALWQGKGLSSSLEAGVALRIGPVSMAAAPQFIYEQNQEFDIATPTRNSNSPYANAWYRIDLPQRFGSEARSRVEPGNSYVRFDTRGFFATVSNENLWIGPAFRNALLTNDNAPGFWHLGLGTARPVNIGIGTIEAYLMNGRLVESEFHDTVSVNDRRLLSAATIVMSPRGAPGLFMGAQRLFVSRMTGAEWLSKPWKSLTESFFTYDNITDDNPTGNSAGNQLFSLYARWVFPRSGFEAYLEWGRDDHSANLEDFVQEPDHTVATTMGFQKVAKWRGRTVRIVGEKSDFQNFTPERLERRVGTFYQHNVYYSHQGQPLGAYTGMSADNHFLGVDVFSDRNSWGLYVERIRRNETAYYANREGTVLFGHDLEMRFGANAQRSLQDFRVSVQAEYANRANREFLKYRSRDKNMSLQLRAETRPRVLLKKTQGVGN